MPRLEGRRGRGVLERVEDAFGYGRAVVHGGGPLCLVCRGHRTDLPCVRIEDAEQTCLGIDSDEGTSGIQIGFCRIRYC